MPNEAEDRALKITHSERDYDQSAWGTVKAMDLLEAVAGMVDQLYRSDLEEATREHALDLAWTACVQGARLLSFFCGEEITKDEVQLIHREGFRAYESVALQRGLISETSIDRKAREARQSAEERDELRRHLLIELDLLSRGPKSNRTEMYDCVRRTELPQSDEQLRLLQDLLERATMGTLSWESLAAVIQDLARPYVTR